MDVDIWQSETGRWCWFFTVGDRRYSGEADSRPAAEVAALAARQGGGRMPELTRERRALRA